ncbi:hypothetical protein CPB83DRAFT_857486 [Crepidotus variabilis]|uniref:Uncharacterized protein n=1 Tax=Crepidotus variabilis TaxID=179855 RepID=A0A9P6ECL7_9AGAR|nr:hypothetical protein CPB83DRAFT_857486 [Crepidotus variabilis]
MDLDEDPCAGVEMEYLETLLKDWQKATSFVYQFFGGGIRSFHFSVDFNAGGYALVIDAIETTISRVARDVTAFEKGLREMEEEWAKEKELRYNSIDVTMFLNFFRSRILKIGAAGFLLNPHARVAMMVLNEAMQRFGQATKVDIDELCTLLNSLADGRLLGPNPFNINNLEVNIDLDLFIEEYPACSRKERARLINKISRQLQDAGYECYRRVDSLFPEGIPPWHQRLAKNAIRKLKSTGDLFHRSKQETPSDTGSAADSDSCYSLIGSGWTAYRCRQLLEEERGN